MFEHDLPRPAEGPAQASPRALSVRDIRAMQTRLAAIIEAAHAAAETESDQLDAIGALEELVCTATAAQAELTVRLDAQRRAAAARAGVPAGRQGRGVASMVAHARRESPHRGRQHLGLAKTVVHELPHTRTVWCRGLITEWAATLIARETACLSIEHRLAVDAAIAADAHRLSGMGLGELTGSLRSLAERLDPAACVKRRRNAEQDRHVSVRPAPDTMTWLGALLPVKDGVAVYAVLSAAADAARATGDARSRGQVMADELVRRITTPDHATGSANPVPVQLNLVMTDQQVFGTDDAPAHLDGYGPIPAELGREILRQALTADEQVWVRRLYTDPHTGAVAESDARARRFRGSLARFIRLRDRTCRTPWCDAPIRHIDHAEGHAAGGTTDKVNGQGLCEACNHAKQADGWRARPGPFGTVVTTLPTGHAYTTAPPRAIGPERRVGWRPEIRVDFVLTG